MEKSKKGHLSIPFVSTAVEEDEAFVLETDDNKEKYKKVRKIHHRMCHPKPEVLKNFFKASSYNTKENLRIIDDVFNDCKICKVKFKKTPPKPKVAMPISNQCVSIDLKGPINNHYILYCVDTFSRLTRAVIIKDKNPSIIVKGILDCWVLGRGIGPGMPGIYS